MTYAIHYSPVRKPPRPGQVYGIQVAILDWLRAWLRHGRQEKLPFLIASEVAQREILDVAAEIGADASRLTFLDSRFPRENLGAFSRVFRADPDSRDLLWQRAYAGASFSFCGLVHAPSGVETARVLEQFCLAPTFAADAIVCPSRAVASAVRRYWDHWAVFMQERFGVSYECPVRLPVIPLGVETARIAAKVSPDKRKDQREKLGVSGDDIVLLWVGRLSYAIKAHPLPMFRAAEEAARQSGKKVRLVMQGYFVPEESGAEFEALARDVCSTARVSFIAPDDARFPDGLWAAGDVFLSLVENVQESFGLTPIEAIAAGLPRVVSDWDGYRDSVTHGQDGFLIPTYAPPPGAGRELAATFLGERETYGGSLALIAQCAAVDYEAAAQAIVELIENPDLRARFAASARERLPSYDWARIIGAYENWNANENAKIPSADIRPSPSVLHPHAPDPFDMFRDYPSAVLSEETRLTVIAPPEEVRLILSHKMNRLAAEFMIGGAGVFGFLRWLASHGGSADLGEIFAAFPRENRAALWRTAGWLLKLGFLRASLPV